MDRYGWFRESWLTKLREFLENFQNCYSNWIDFQWKDTRICQWAPASQGNRGCVKILPRQCWKMDDNTPVKHVRLEQTGRVACFAETMLAFAPFTARLSWRRIHWRAVDGKLDNAETANPLDPEFIETPFQGKYVIMFKNFRQLRWYLFIDQIRHDNFPKSLQKYMCWIYFGQ